MAQPIVITSPLHLKTLLSSTPSLIADFHATWCGPCHAIAPVYSQLSSANSAPEIMTFVKIDVDAQQEIAREYSISAMPTFLVFKEGKVVETIRGANPPALRAAVAKARTAGEKVAAAKKAKEELKKKSVDEGSRVKGEETSVSGSYGITKGTGWKMSLN
jgi:thioredoxin 1